jgi:hypothetical protein
MKKIMFWIICFVLATKSYSDEGDVYKGDLNGDGVIDKIESGPSYMFGNGGGPFLVTLSGPKNDVKKSIIGAHIGALYLERHQRGNQLWGYWHMSAFEGELFTISLDGKFIRNSVKIYTGKIDLGDSDMGKMILDSVKSKASKIDFDYIEDYVLPEASWGK